MSRLASPGEVWTSVDPRDAGAARNVDGRAILYADQITGSMRRALDETERRRAKQIAFNEENGITPKTIQKAVADVMRHGYEEYSEVKERKKVAEVGADYARMTPSQLAKEIEKLEKQMFKHAENLEFEQAGEIRDRIGKLREHAFELPAKAG